MIGRGVLILALAPLIACAGSAQIEVQAPDDAPPPRATASLRLTDAELEGQPRNQVDLIVVHDRGDREVIPVGMIEGICTYDRQSPAGSLQVVRCWWAGEETSLRLRHQSDALRVIDDSGAVLAETALAEGTEVSPL